MMEIMRHRFSVASGALACLASVFGKVAFDANTSFHAVAKQLCSHHLDDSATCNVVGLVVQGISLAGMVMVNALMFSTYLKALQQSGSTIATVTNCATNFILSGVSGRILFGEQLPGQWFYGATFIVAGVAFIAGSDGQLQEKSKVT